MNPKLLGGRYELLDWLGAGAMGQVYRASDWLTDEVIALKRVRQEPSAAPRLATSSATASTVTSGAAEAVPPAEPSPERLRVAPLALASEFRILSSLRHPNIISVLDYGFEANWQPFFTMTLLSNAMTITDAARDESPTVRVRFLFQFLQALSYLHAHGVIHRDLKPSNVMVVGAQVTVLDFGLSGLPLGTFAGTPAYMAPEIHLGNEPTPASDLYAVGVIAYEVLTDRRLFTSDRNWNDPPDLTALNFNPKLAALTRQLLSIDPEDRGTDVNHLIADFAAAAGEELPGESVANRESHLKAAPLTGRKQELAQLLQALETAREGRGSGWLVTGESGIGKSRLLDELRSHALVDGALVLTGRATGEGAAPYSLFRDAVLRLSLVVEMSDSQAAILKAVYPEIENVLHRSIAELRPPDPQLFSDALVDSIVDLVSRSPAPVLLELEDCHFIRESSKVLLELTRLMDVRPLLIVASYRHDERPHMLEEFPQMHVLRLLPLSRFEIREMSVSMLGKELGSNETIVSFLERETEGNPFFLVEAVRALAEERGGLGQIIPEVLPEHVFAGGMKDAVHRRLDRLPSWAHSCLQLAAVIGREVDVTILRAAESNTDVDMFLTVCAETAILEGLGYRWRFTHSKLREAILADLDPENRQDLHRRVATAIERVHGDPPEWINALAFHWKQAEDREKAAHYLFEAAAQMLSTGVPEKAVKLAVDAAGHLGLEIPQGPEELPAAVNRQMEEITRLLGGRGARHILHLPVLHDERVGRLMKVLKLLQPAAHISKHFELFVLSTLKCMALTMEHGIGNDAPEALATYAAVVRDLTGDTRLAYSFSQLAMDLDRRVHGRVSSPVTFLHAWFVNHWNNPVKTNLSLALEGSQTGFDGGDVLYGSFNAAAYVIYLSLTGAPLRRVIQAAEQQMARIGGRVRVAAFHCLLERQLALALAGCTQDRLSFTDADYDEERDLASICATSNHNQIGYFCTAKMRLHYYHYDYQTALRYAQQALLLKAAFQGQVAEWEFTFFYALSVLGRASQVVGTEREHLLKIAAQLLERVSSWAELCETNFRHKRDLIEAEFLRLQKRGSEAATIYERAAALAAEHGFTQDAALSHERAARFFDAHQNIAQARFHFEQALGAYKAWGAAAKVASLGEHFPSYVAKSISQPKC